MKVTVFVGSWRKKHTYNAAVRFLEKLEAFGDVEGEITALCDYDLKICRGCKMCTDHGEENCPLKDDRDKLIKKMADSDGVVFASPNYSFQVSGLMKVFLDRLGFVFHRPRFFGRTFTCIVAQGIYGGNDIVKYLDFVGGGLGFNVVRGVCITTLEPMTEKRRIKNEGIIDGLSRRFHAQLVKKKYPVPSLFKLMLFRMSRTSIRMILEEGFRDFTYYRDKGWFGSDYFYPVKLGPVKKLAGRLFDAIGVRIAKNG